MNQKSPVEKAEVSVRVEETRKPWTRPVLRRMDALDAEMPGKTRHVSDAFHLS